MEAVMIGLALQIFVWLPIRLFWLMFHVTVWMIRLSVPLMTQMIRLSIAFFKWSMIGMYQFYKWLAIFAIGIGSLIQTAIQKRHSNT